MHNQPGRLDYLFTISILFLFVSPTITRAANIYGSFGIGVPHEAIEAINDAGAINIIKGSARGLNSKDNTLWHQDTYGIINNAETGDQFGTVLAAGDFNNDGFPDLAAGVPGEDIDGVSDAGAVHVIYGSKKGLTSDNNQIWYQGTPNILETPEVNDQFGLSLASGDFNGDGFTDLAAGTPWEDLEAISNAGVVNVIYGSPQGLAAQNNQIWHQNIAVIVGGAETGDLFGRSLASGDFNGDGYTDLAIGVDSEDIGSISNAGAVQIIYGSGQGLTSANNQIWHQNIAGIDGGAEGEDFFGWSLATGDFNHDNYTDLAIGIPAEDIGAVIDAGAVQILFGSAQGITINNNQLWYQGLTGILGLPETFDNFGWSLAAGDVNNDGFADLAIGVPNEAIGATIYAGAINVLYGSTVGISSNNNQLWHQDSNGIAGRVEAFDQLGWSLVFIPPAEKFSWPMFLPAINAGRQSSPTPKPFTISSTSFSNNQPISTKYTLYGANTSPQLSWTSVPAGTASFMLTVIDPDGGDWLHWKIKLPGTVTSLAENSGRSGGANLPAGSIRYDNDFKGYAIPGADGTDYDGPRPPAGSGVHHYNFKLTALDSGNAELDSVVLTGTYE